jgi:hypothetical protein
VIFLDRYPGGRDTSCVWESFDLTVMLDLVNRERTCRGLHPLTRDSALDAVAYTQMAWVIWVHVSDRPVVSCARNAIWYGGERHTGWLQTTQVSCWVLCYQP